MMEQADRKNADDAKADGEPPRRKAYKSPELVKRGPVAKVAAATWVPPAGPND